MISTRPIHHSRLCDAADALLDAIDKDGHGALITMRADQGPPPPAHSVDDARFTQQELVEAMSLLLRLDLV